MLQDGRPDLIPNTTLFGGFIEQTKCVTPTCLVHAGRNRYGMPASFANHPISVRPYHDRMVMVAEGQVVAEHVRHIRRTHDGGHAIFDWHQYSFGRHLGNDHRIHRMATSARGSSTGAAA